MRASTYAHTDTKISLMFGCVCLCDVYMCMQMFYVAYIHIQAKGQYWMSSLIAHHLFVIFETVFQ